MNLTQLKKYIIDNCKDLSKEDKREINDIWQLAVSEIEDGESEENECTLAKNDIDEILLRRITWE